MKYEIRDNGSLFIEGEDNPITVGEWIGKAKLVIRHLESEISKKDDEIKGLREVIHNYEQFGKAEIEASKEPFIFTKDTPVRTSCGDAQILWDDEQYLYGRVLIINKWYPCNWWKENGHADNMTSEFDIIPILPEKRVVDVWVGTFTSSSGYELFKNQFDAEQWAKDYNNRNIEHHAIELKGQSNV